MIFQFLAILSLIICPSFDNMCTETDSSKLSVPLKLLFYYNTVDTREIERENCNWVAEQGRREKKVVVLAVHITRPKSLLDKESIV